jgi:[ribosomal protein S18]-alanine N-acetyltransferase
VTPNRMAAIHARCFTQPRPWTEREFIDLLDSDAVFSCVAEHGFALGRIAGPEAELLTLAVDPLHQRQGLAQGLMRNFDLQAKASGASETFLEVARNNIVAIALYKKLGFAQAGLRKNYYASPNGVRISALVMTRVL